MAPRAQTQPLVFLPFEKIEKQDDGTLIVSGIASTEKRDSDGEMITADAMRGAIPDYMTFGAVREMHQKIAAGTAIACHVDDDGVTHLESLIVDPVSVKKVETGVLKGYSIAGPVTKRNKLDKSIIEGLKLIEISLVDRPANPDAKILLYKFDKSGRVVSKPSITDVAEPTTIDDLQKGMYDVSRLAELVQSLYWLMQSATYEADTEGDNSAMPAALRACCVQLCAALRDMVTEETAELVGLGEDDASMTILMAAKAETSEALAKAGRRFSSTTQKQLGKVHTSMKECCDALDKLGYMDTSEKAAAVSEDIPTPELSEELEMMNDVEKAELAKAQGAVKEQTDAITKAQSENVELKARLEKAEAAIAAATDQLKVASETADKLADVITKAGLVTVVPKGKDGLPSPVDLVDKSKKPEVGNLTNELRASFAVPMAPIQGRLTRV